MEVSLTGSAQMKQSSASGGSSSSLSSCAATSCVVTCTAVVAANGSASCSAAACCGWERSFCGLADLEWLLERPLEVEAAARLESEGVREPPKLARRPPPPLAPPREEPPPLRLDEEPLLDPREEEEDDGGGFDSCVALIVDPCRFYRGADRRCVVSVQCEGEAGSCKKKGELRRYEQRQGATKRSVWSSRTKSLCAAAMTKDASVACASLSRDS